MEWILCLIAVLVLTLVLRVISLFKHNENLREKEQELWSGVYDTKRDVDTDLVDPDERERLRQRYNDNP